MPRFGVRGHPQEKRIIEALKQGQKLHEITAWLSPKLSMSAISRFRSKFFPRQATVEMSVADITRSASVISSTLTQNAVSPAIGSRVSLAAREKRLVMKQDRADKLNQVMIERGKDMEVCESCRRPESAHPWEEMRPVVVKGKTVLERFACDQMHRIPGGTTGLIIRKPRAGGGLEYAIDTSFLTAIDQLEKDIAIEMGQWQEGHNGTQLQVQIIVPWAGDRPAVRVTHDDDPANTIDIGEMAAAPKG